MNHTVYILVGAVLILFIVAVITTLRAKLDGSAHASSA